METCDEEKRRATWESLKRRSIGLETGPKKLIYPPSMKRGEELSLFSLRDLVDERKYRHWGEDSEIPGGRCGSWK